MSECSGVWCPSVVCAELRARSVSECREHRFSVSTGLDIEPDGACISLSACLLSSEVGSSDCFGYLNKWKLNCEFRN